MATLGPWERIHAAGYAYRQATGRPPSLTTLVGVWLIFGPTAVAIPLFLNRVRGASLVPLLLVAVVWFAAVAILVRVTGNYYDRPPRIESVDPSDTESGGPWRCPECGEEIDAQFTDCWKCGTSRPGATQ